MIERAWLRHHRASIASIVATLAAVVVALELLLAVAAMRTDAEQRGSAQVVPLGWTMVTSPDTGAIEGLAEETGAILVVESDDRLHRDADDARPIAVSVRRIVPPPDLGAPASMVGGHDDATARPGTYVSSGLAALIGCDTSCDVAIGDGPPTTASVFTMPSDADLVEARIVQPTRPGTGSNAWILMPRGQFQTLDLDRSVFDASSNAGFAPENPLVQRWSVRSLLLPALLVLLLVGGSLCAVAVLRLDATVRLLIEQGATPDWIRSRLTTLGASIGTIAGVLGGVIALALSSAFRSRWEQPFNQRWSLSAWPFLLAGLAVVVLAVVGAGVFTVVFGALRARIEDRSFAPDGLRRATAILAAAVVPWLALSGFLGLAGGVALAIVLALLVVLALRAVDRRTSSFAVALAIQPRAQVTWLTVLFTTVVYFCAMAVLIPSVFIANGQADDDLPAPSDTMTLLGGRQSIERVTRDVADESLLPWVNATSSQDASWLPRLLNESGVRCVEETADLRSCIESRLQSSGTLSGIVGVMSDEDFARFRASVGVDDGVDGLISELAIADGPGVALQVFDADLSPVGPAVPVAARPVPGLGYYLPSLLVPATTAMAMGLDASGPRGGAVGFFRGELGSAEPVIRGAALSVDPGIQVLPQSGLVEPWLRTLQRLTTAAFLVGLSALVVALAAVLADHQRASRTLLVEAGATARRRFGLGCAQAGLWVGASTVAAIAAAYVGLRFGTGQVAISITEIVPRSLVASAMLLILVGAAANGWNFVRAPSNGRD